MKDKPWVPPLPAPTPPDVSPVPSIQALVAMLPLAHSPTAAKTADIVGLLLSAPYLTSSSFYLSGLKWSKKESQEEGKGSENEKKN